jgi:hypothetical protein
MAASQYKTAGADMKREPVDSSTIASIGYMPQRCTLEVEFRDSGDVYLYFDVPAQEHAEFMAAESKGFYLNHIFKPKGHRFVIRKKGSGALSLSEVDRRRRTG